MVIIAINQFGFGSGKPITLQYSFTLHCYVSKIKPIIVVGASITSGGVLLVTSAYGLIWSHNHYLNTNIAATIVVMVVAMVVVIVLATVVTMIASMILRCLFFLQLQMRCSMSRFGALQLKWGT